MTPNRAPLSTLTLVLAALAALPGAASAAFRFESTVVEVQAEFGAERATAVFRFTNAGSAPATVRGIETSCGCLSAKSDKKTYAPGESGQVEAVFNIKGMSGSVERSVSFESATRGEAPVRLAVRVHIPLLIEIEPKMTEWKVGEPPAPKRARIVMKGDEPIRVKNLSSSRRNVSAVLHEIEPGRVYEIEMVPDSTAASLLGVVRFETDTRFREQQRQMAFYRIGGDE
jgi:hypothetical protein